jgi:Galactose oxidase, central domain/Kelch motif
MKKLWLLSLILSGLSLLNGCGSQSTVGVSVQPSSATVLLSTSQPFMAVVTGTTNVAVTWSVKEGGAGGSIDNQGNYTAPQIAGTYHVIATSIADQSKSGSATITVPLAVNVSPNPATVFLGGTQTFTATVAGSNNQAVTWSVQEGTAGGSIDNQGNYTAPQVPGTFHVVATSLADPTQSAPATVTVPPVSVTVSPDPATVFLGATQAFTATVTATNTAVTWSVQEGAAGGSIDSQGNYTAPQVIGTYHVIATSLADKTKSGSATITVPPVAVSISPTADTLGPNSQRTFVATVTGTTNTTVTWMITEGAAGGTVVDGSYTAPAKQGTFHVVATSVADPTKSATATVTGVASGFLAIANMTAKRAVHTATLLSTGKALLAGGINHYMKVQQGFRSACFPVATNLAELFDPGSGTFTATGAMSTPRSAHTATVLPDNKVLVAGGSSITPPTAEIYDPATEAFTVTGNMVSVRLRHTATLLPSGKVLLAGGDGVGATAELFDPATGTFAATGSMTDSRSSHTATLLVSGKVLIAGGIDAAGRVSTAELYDPVAGTFTATGSMGTARGSHTATLLPNGTVLIAGGDDLNGAPLASAEIYDPMTGTFTATGSMVATHTKHTATLLQSSGKVLIAGGGNYVAELFDPAAGTFTQTGSMFLSRTSHAALLLPSGQVVVTGSATPVIFSCLGGATTSAEDYK